MKNLILILLLMFLTINLYSFDFGATVVKGKFTAEAEAVFQANLTMEADAVVQGNMTVEGSVVILGTVEGTLIGEATSVSSIAGLAPDTQNTYSRTQYLIPYASSTTAWGQIAIGTDGQVLTSGGAGSAPTFEDAGGGGGSLWSESGSDIYFSSGIIGIGTTPSAGAQVYISNTSKGSALGISNTYASSTASLWTSTSGATTKALDLDIGNGSYTGDSIDVTTTRASSSSFNFMIFKGFTDLEFKFSGDGNGTCDGSWTGGGADYAEYFECTNKNSFNIGDTVIIENGLIVKANSGDTPIGVIRTKDSVGFIGNNPLNDPEKYKKNSYGKREKDNNGSKVLNSSYVEVLFVLYKDRNDKILVGLLGQIPITKNEIINPNWVFIREIDSNVNLYLVK